MGLNDNEYANIETVGSASRLRRSVFGCLALSAVTRADARGSGHGIASPPAAWGSAATGSGFPAACYLLRNGFDLTPGPDPVPGEAVEYVTSGGYTISVNLGTVRVTDAIGLNTLVHSGVLHEYLNGKHIKDWGGESEWDDARRSLIVDDGTKLTLVSNNHSGIILHTSIFDGDENLQIDNCSNQIVHQSVDATDTQQRDAAQYDGEVAAFSTDATSGMGPYSNEYNEDGNRNVIDIHFILGATGGYANPNQVTDYYDDPRRGNT